MLWVTWLLLLLLPGLAWSATYHVDQSTGSDSLPNDGTQGAPWKTISKCAQVAVSGDSCLMRAGTYRETVTPAANGVTFQPDGSAVVTVSGADLVTGWTVHSGSGSSTIYKSTSLSLPLGVDNQVFVDGQMVNLARWPNASLDVSHPQFATADSSSPNDVENCDIGTWTLNDSALSFSSGFWTGAEITHMAAGMYSQSGTVTASSNGQVQFTSTHTTQSRCMESPYGQQYPYYLSNKLAALDAAGEWYYDTGTTTLYLRTPSSDSPAGHTVEAKRRPFAFNLNNRSNITIKNIKVFAASIDMNPSSSNHVLDGLDMHYVWHQLRNYPSNNGTVNGATQYDPKWGAWNTGVRLAGSNSVLKNCTIAYSSHNGVYIRGTNNRVENCIIHDVAYLKTEGGAVSWMGDDVFESNPGCTGNTVTRSTMYTSGRYMVNFYYCPNFEISYNLIYDACIQVGDCGFLYTSKGGTSGTVHHNIMHGNVAEYYIFGIYMDAKPENYTLHHNVIYDVPGIGFNIGHPAVNINAYNNTVWTTATWEGQQKSIVNAGDMTNVKTYNNLTMAAVSGTDVLNNAQTNSGCFINAGGGNFQLQNTCTAAINQGRVISGITDGYSGSAPDIGAYEFGVTAWTAGATAPVACTCGTAGCEPCPCPCGTEGCPACPATDAQAWWQFDETGGSATDSSGHTHTGTLAGGVTRVAGHVGSGALQFDGIDDRVTLTDAVLPSWAGDSSVCLWALATGNATGGSGGFYQSLVHLALSTSNGLRITMADEVPTARSGLWAVSLWTGSSSVAKETTAAAFPTNGTWAHLCYTYAGGVLTLYTNGDAQATTSPSAYSLGGSASFLGTRTPTTGGWQGRLDEVKVWNRGLSAAEVKTESAGGPGRAPRHRVVAQ